MKLQALIFDVDGTLADTEEAHRSAFNDAFDELGLGWNWSKSTYAHLLLTTGGKERLMAFIKGLGLPAAKTALLHLQVDEIHRRKTHHYTHRLLTGQVALRDGVERLLMEARACGIRLAIASTTTFSNIELLVQSALGPQALAIFEVIGAADQAVHKKPAPDIYDYVLRKLHLPAAGCVALEDSGNGLRAAKLAGLYTIVTPTRWTMMDDFSAADLVLPSLGSDKKPLPEPATVLIGNSLLGVREIECGLAAATTTFSRRRETRGTA